MGLQLRRSKGGLDIAVTGAQYERFCGQAGRETAGSRTGVQDRRQLFSLYRNQLSAILG